MEPEDSAEALAVRSAAGDPEAIFILALSLLNASGAAQDLPGAHAALLRAGDMGYTPAARVHAHLVAAGIGVSADEAKALQLLRQIADRDAHAAAQLAMLNHVAEPVSFRRHILHQSPDVILVEGLLAPDECKYLISVAAPRVQPAMVDNNAPGGGRRDPHRTSYDSSFGPGDEDLVFQRINRRIARETGTGYDCGEPMHILRYTPGQEYRPHMDTIAGASNQRVWTALVYLSDGYQGGETDFPHLNVGIEGAPGDAVLFRSVDAGGRPDPRTQHAGLPVTAGTKWLASRLIRQSRYVP